MIQDIKFRKDSSANMLDHPYNIYLFKVNNRNTRKSCEMC